MLGGGSRYSRPPPHFQRFVFGTLETALAIARTWKALARAVRDPARWAKDTRAKVS
jgi:hypothetical protein